METNHNFGMKLVEFNFITILTYVVPNFQTKKEHYVLYPW
jgi:hypothetical protein